MDSPSRYITFNGLECDAKARLLVAKCRITLQSKSVGQPVTDYFHTKLKELEQRGQDELYFIHSQANTLYDLFELAGNETATQRLKQLEEECC